MRAGVTGSKSALLLECQWFANALAEWFDQTSDAADRGARAHEAIASYVRAGMVPLPLDEDIKSLFEVAQRWVDIQEKFTGRPFAAEMGLAWDPVNDVATMLTETGRDYSRAPTGWFCATTDLSQIDLDAKVGWIWDWKTGDGSKATMQLRTLAVMFARAFGLETVHVAALEVGWDGIRTLCQETLGAFELAAHAGALAEAIMAIPTAQPRPGRHCGDLYCPARATCPAATAIVAEIIPPEALARHKWGIQIASAEHAAWLYDQAKAVEAAAKQVKDAVKAYVPAEGLLLEDGSTLIEGSRNMPRFNRERAVTLMRALGATEEQIEACTSISPEGTGLKRVGGPKVARPRKPRAA